MKAVALLAGPACFATMGMMAIDGLSEAAVAQETGTNWAFFDPQSGGGRSWGGSASTNRYDNSFAKQWEANPPKGFPTLSAQNIEATKAAIKKYETIVERGGWKQVPDVMMQMGSAGSGVGLLRERLAISGDLRSNEGGFFGETYGTDLEKGVKRFQASNGLTPTGIVDRRTVAALNVPAAVRLKQLKVNLARLQSLVNGTGKKYVIVNIPSAQIEAVENNKVVSRHAGVVGKIDRQTPLLKSTIHELNFNPVWHLPPTVIQKDLVPKGQLMSRRGQDVLAKYGIEAFGSDGRKLDTSKINWSSSSARNLTFRQAPGPENPLGFVKINFHNGYSVYMHDSPSQNLFGRNFRAASSGCVRVSGIDQLATWLTSEQGWTHDKVAHMKKSGERFDFRLKKPVPLFFTYITAWATEDGVIQFRRDIYNKDNVGDVASAY
ncbi:MAG: L,D-transpeptidase family protein [Hyphomicrobiaceae bacterium]